MWHGKSLFHCKSNTGCFVALDMISELPKGNVQIDDPNIPGKNSSSHDQQPLQVCGLGALEPFHTSDNLITQKSFPQSTTQAGHHDKDEIQTNLGFEIGSLVQVIDPPLYGVIQVIGEFPKILGMAAGIELVSQSVLQLFLSYSVS